LITTNTIRQIKSYKEFHVYAESKRLIRSLVSQAIMQKMNLSNHTLIHWLIHWIDDPYQMDESIV